MIYNSYQRYRAKHKQIADEIRDIIDPQEITAYMDYMGEIEYIYSGYYLEIHCNKCGRMIYSTYQNEEIIQSEELFVIVDHERKIVSIPKYLEKYEDDILKQLYEMNSQLRKYQISIAGVSVLH